MIASANSPGPASGTDPVLAELFEEIAAKLQAGEPVDLEAYAQRYPEQADALRRLLPAMEVLADLGRSAPRSGPRAVATDTGPGILGDFRLVREVGRGGMGVVYEAEQISLGRRVALKVLPFAAALDSRQLQRFRNEAQAAAQLHHTNVVPIYGVGCERGVHFYAMQYIDGQTLAAVIRDWRQLRAIDELPQAPGEREQLGRVHQYLAEVLYETGRLPEAEQALRRALDLQEELATERPNMPACRRELARTLHSLGNVLRAAGRTRAAEDAYRRAMALRQKLADDAPQVPEYHRDLAETLKNLTELLDERAKSAR